jgi:hypothetical protein
MKEILGLLVGCAFILFLFGTVADAEDKDDGSYKSCRYWTTKQVVSKTSGALGNVINVKRIKSNGPKECSYDVRLYLNGQLVVVEHMWDWELMWAPEKEVKEAEAGTPDPKTYVENLDFGGKQ